MRWTYAEFARLPQAEEEERQSRLERLRRDVGVGLEEPDRPTPA